MSYCPECEAVIDEEFEDVGQLVSCPECGVELEVISVDPVEFDLAVDDDDDDSEDEYGYDDDDEENEEDDDWDEDIEDDEKEDEY